LVFSPRFTPTLLRAPPSLLSSDLYNLNKHARAHEQNDSVCPEAKGDIVCLRRLQVFRTFSWLLDQKQNMLLSDMIVDAMKAERQTKTLKSITDQDAADCSGGVFVSPAKAPSCASSSVVPPQVESAAASSEDGLSVMRFFMARKKP